MESWQRIYKGCNFFVLCFFFSFSNYVYTYSWTNMLWSYDCDNDSCMLHEMTKKDSEHIKGMTKCCVINKKTWANSFIINLLECDYKIHHSKEEKLKKNENIILIEK